LSLFIVGPDFIGVLAIPRWAPSPLIGRSWLKNGQKLKARASAARVVHPGYSDGAETSLLVKSNCGKDANQKVWKFDSALEARIADDFER
jgi:hypothetical protein